MADLLALAGLYLAGMFYTNNISIDQYWWWWVIHPWVEATWEVFVASVIGWALIKIIGANRQIVEMWLWIEVAMLFGSGIWESGITISGLEHLNIGGKLEHFLCT